MAAVAAAVEEAIPDVVAGVTAAMARMADPVGSPGVQDGDFEADLNDLLQSYPDCLPLRPTKGSLPSRCWTRLSTRSAPSSGRPVRRDARQSLAHAQEKEQGADQ